MDVKRMRDILLLSDDELEQLKAKEISPELSFPQLNDPILITNEEVDRLLEGVTEELDRLKEQMLSELKNEVKL